MNLWFARSILVLLLPQLVMGQSFPLRGPQKTDQIVAKGASNPAPFRWVFVKASDREIQFRDSDFHTHTNSIPIPEGERVLNVSFDASGAWLQFLKRRVFLSNEELEDIVQMNHLALILEREERRKEKANKIKDSIVRTATITLGIFVTALVLKIKFENEGKSKGLDAARASASSGGDLNGNDDKPDYRGSFLSIYGHAVRTVSVAPLVVGTHFINYVSDRFLIGSVGRTNAFSRFLSQTLEESIRRDNGITISPSLVRTTLSEVPLRTLLAAFGLFVLMPGLAGFLDQNVGHLTNVFSGFARNSPESMETKWFILITAFITWINNGPALWLRTERNRLAGQVYRKAKVIVLRRNPGINTRSATFRRILIKTAFEEMEKIQRTSGLPRRGGFLFDAQSLMRDFWRNLGFRGSETRLLPQSEYLLEESPGALTPILSLTSKTLWTWASQFPRETKIIDALEELSTIRRNLSPLSGVAVAVLTREKLTRWTHFDELAFDGEIKSQTTSNDEHDPSTRILREAFRRSASAVMDGNVSSPYLIPKDVSSTELWAALDESDKRIAANRQIMTALQERFWEPSIPGAFEAKQRDRILAMATEDLGEKSTTWLAGGLERKHYESYINAYAQVLGFDLKIIFEGCDDKRSGILEAAENELKEGRLPEEDTFISRMRSGGNNVRANEFLLLETAHIFLTKTIEWVRSKESGIAAHDKRQPGVTQGIRARLNRPDKALLVFMRSIDAQFGQGIPALGFTSWVKTRTPLTEELANTAFRSVERIPTMSFFYLTYALLYGVSIPVESYWKLFAAWPVFNFSLSMMTRVMAANGKKDLNKLGPALLYGLLVELVSFPINFLSTVFVSGMEPVCDAALAPQSDSSVTARE